MCHNRRINPLSRMLSAKQAIGIIGIAVKPCVRTKFVYKRNFSRVFRQMRLHRQLVLLLDNLQLCEQLRRARRNKARRQYRFGALILSRDFIQPAQGLLCGCLCAAFPQVIRRLSIHIDLADKADQPRLLHAIHQQFRRRAVLRGEQTCVRCRTVLDIVRKNRICFIGIGKVCVFGFFRKCLLTKPIHQFQIHAHAAECILRRMHVQIYQAWNNQLSGKIVYRKMRILLGQLRKNALRSTIFAHGIGVFHRCPLVFRLAKTNVAFDCKALFRIHENPAPFQSA